RDKLVTGVQTCALPILQQRLDGTVAIRFRERYLKVSECQRPAKVAPQPKRSPARQPKKRQPSPALRAAMKNLLQSPALPVWQARSEERRVGKDGRGRAW